MNVPEWEMLAAQRAYEAYSKYTGGRSLVSGDKLPEWKDLSGNICNAWHSAIKASIEIFKTERLSKYS